ncbi:MAG: FAD:protein FMN transferase [Candidatus Omnitrophota bacterium]|nr:FAD:protein FMN transferase [Candidatus Omnitrophota bacterium]
MRLKIRIHSRFSNSYLIDKAVRGREMYNVGFRKFLILILIVGWGIIFLNSIGRYKNTFLTTETSQGRVLSSPTSLVNEVSCRRLLTRQNHQFYKDTQAIMGTFVEVISPEEKAKDIVFTEIKRIENLLSKYKADSEISKLNEFGALKVSPETFYVIEKAKEFSLASAGAFDVTVGPLLDLWGFRDKNYTVPKEEDIKLALSKVGSDKIILNKKNNVVEFKVTGMKIDLGAIAAGFAVDCAIDKLKKAQIKSCLINAGGDIYCLGEKEGRPWKVAIQNPFKSRQFNRKTLLLKNQAVTTSGNYEQFFLKNKKRYSHIFNPKTGEPSSSGLASVSVIAPDCLTADALATSIFALGKAKGDTLAKKFSGVKVIVIEENN